MKLTRPITREEVATARELVEACARLHQAKQHLDAKHPARAVLDSEADRLNRAFVRAYKFGQLANRRKKG